MEVKAVLLEFAAVVLKHRATAMGMDLVYATSARIGNRARLPQNPPRSSESVRRIRQTPEARWEVATWVRGRPHRHHASWLCGVLDTFDLHSPRCQSYHTHYEVFRWFEEAGLERIRVRAPGIGLTGQRPVGRSPGGHLSVAHSSISL